MNRFFSLVGASVLVLALSAVGVLVVNRAATPTSRVINITARKYAYDPPIIRLNQGDRVTIHLKALDVTHGFYLEGYDIDAHITPGEKPLLCHPSYEKDFKQVDSIHFVANKTGKFRYRCSMTCGFMHPFMLGEMTVAPNRPFGAGVGAAIGLALAMLILAVRSGRSEND